MWLYVTNTWSIRANRLRNQNSMVRKVQVFTNDMGQEVNIPEEDITTIDSNPNYDVIQARHNPSGEVLTKVVYRNPVR